MFKSPGSGADHDSMPLAPPTPDTGRVGLGRARGWVWLIVIGALPLPVYLWVLDGVVAELLFDASVLTILLVGLVAAWRLPRHRAAWTTIIVGHLLFVGGDIAFMVNGQLLDREVYPSEADVLYLSAYAVITVGLALLLRSQAKGRDLGGAVDGLILAVAAGVVLWVWLMAPTVGDPDLPLLERAVTIAYPAGDLLLLTVGLQLAMAGIRRMVPLALLATSLTLMLAADLGYVRAVLLDSYTVGNALDAGWWLAYLLIAAAVVHPQAVELADPPAERPVARLRVPRLVLLAAAILLSPVLLAFRGAEGSWAGAPVLIGGTIVLFVLVVFRLVLVNRELEVSREQLWHEATHDALTGLANRALFADLLGRALVRRRHAGNHAAVLFIDLDDFKIVNDSLGHATGDRLLRAISDRLRDLMRPGDAVARLGGDEFAVLLDDVTVHDAERVAARIIATIRLPVETGGEISLRTNASVGITFGDASNSVHDVLRDADIAMYLAKSSGKGRWEVFRPGMRQAVLDRLELREELVEAVARGELVLHYQPIIELATGDVHAAEALLRWEHPIRGLVEPDAFIPIAEETGLIVDIGAWTIHEACRQARIWNSSAEGISVTVNLSPVQLADPGLLEVVRHALSSTGLAPARLVLELSESTVLSDVGCAASRLRELRLLGVRIALDDFGAGSTSVQHLGAFPLDVIKFDRGFVTSEFAGNTFVLDALVELADRMGLDTVAEGVETDEHLATIDSTRCRFVQGFRYSPAVSPSAFDALLSLGPDAWPAAGERSDCPAGPSSVTT